MRFEFSTAHRIIFGQGTLKEIGPVVTTMGDRVCVVTGSTPQRAGPLLDILSFQGKSFTIFCTKHEPTIETIRIGTEQARKAQCDFVIGFGGGSALDTAKAIALLLTNKGDILDYVEIIGKGRPITTPCLPWIAIPTTAGSGAEVTRNSVIASPDHKVKVSLRSQLMLACLVIVDPQLTYSMPPHITATTGLDALTQLIESYVSASANPLTDSLCREGMRRAASSLVKAYKDGNNAQAREDMAISSLFGGMALANSKLGAVHGIAGPMGGMLKAPHGALCARLLPHVISVNVKALRNRLPDSFALKRYDEISQILTGDIKAVSEDFMIWAVDMCTRLDILPLASYGLREEDFPLLIEKALRASSMQGNPLKLTASEIEEILTKSL